jgi:hypothetical protein
MAKGQWKLTYRRTEVNEMKQTILKITLTQLLLLTSNVGYAVSCSDTETGIFDNQTDLNVVYSACLDFDKNNGDRKVMNSDAYFGISDWVLVDSVQGKANGAGKAKGITEGIAKGPEKAKGKAKGIGNNPFNPVNLVVNSVGDASGDLIVESSIWDEYEEIAVVLKGGKTADGVTQSAYLLAPEVDEGFWIYGHDKNGQLKDLKRLTIYGSVTSAVPVPASIWMFASGLLAIITFARRKFS